MVVKRGYWVGYSYKGYVGKGVVGADKDGFMQFVNDEDYEDWLRENGNDKN